MAPNIIRQKKKTTKPNFWCDSCMLSGKGTLESHDSAVHRPTPSMYLKKRVVKKIFRPKTSKLKKTGIINQSNSSNYLKCKVCQEYVPFRIYIEHMIEHAQKRRKVSKKIVLAPQVSYVLSYSCNTDEEVEEFNIRRYLYSKHDPKFNGPDSILTCLTCNELFMNLDKFESHNCPQLMEERQKRRFVYPRNDPRFNVKDDSMLTCLKCDGIFDTRSSFESHKCFRQTSFVSLDREF